MKKYLLVLFLISIFLTGCAAKNSINSDYEFKAQPVIKSVGNIEVIIDPNVEMMNILGRLANLIPFKKNDVEISNYTNNLITIIWFLSMYLEEDTAYDRYIFSWQIRRSK